MRFFIKRSDLKVQKGILFFGLFLVLIFCPVYLASCNKSDHPFGINAPLGLDRPTLTPTPQTGAIEVYVQDVAIVSSGAVQGVSIYLLEPGGVTFGVEQTQPVVGYAAFNPSNLISGIWTAVVPAQSVSYEIGSSGVTTNIHRAYGNSTLPVTVSGPGQYGATFIAEGNTVSISPVSQTMTIPNPDFLAVTVTYSETGNLDVPVTASMSGLPNLLFFNYLNPNTWQFGGGNPYFAAVTISRTSCYAQPISLTLNSDDLVGNHILNSGAVITKGWSIPVTLLVDKNSGCGSNCEYFNIQVGSALDCGSTLYSLSYQVGTSDPPGGTVHGPIALGGGATYPVTYITTDDPYIKAILTYPGGTLTADVQAQNLSFGSYSDFGHTNY